MQSPISRLEQSSGLANLASIIGFLITIVTTLLGAYAWFRSRLNKLQVDKQELVEDRARKDTRIVELRARITHLEDQLSEAVERHPESALDRAAKEWENGNFVSGHKRLADWLRAEGSPIARILAHEARLTAGAAIGERSHVMLVSSQAYSVAALAFSPKDQETGVTLREVENRLTEQVGTPPDISVALVQSSQWTDNFDYADFAENPYDLLEEASRNYDTGLFHLADATAEAAAEAFKSAQGSRSRGFLRANSFRAQALTGLSRNTEALSLIEKTLGSQRQYPGIGVADPDTLWSELRRGYVLAQMGADDVVLPAMTELSERLDFNPAVGPEHPLSYAVRMLEGTVLARTHRQLEARKVIESVLAEIGNDSALGPDDARALQCHEELLSIAIRTGDLALAEQHAEPLRKSLFADMEHIAQPSKLQALALFAKAALHSAPEPTLKVLEFAAEKARTHPALGPAHPSTQSITSMKIDALFVLRRFGDAATCLTHLEEDALLEPDAGSASAEERARARGVMRARILHELGNDQSALSVMSDALHQHSGTNRPSAFERIQLAKILMGAKKAEEADTELRDLIQTVLMTDSTPESRTILETARAMREDIARNRTD